MKNNIFNNKKDLTISIHWTIKSSIVKKINKISKEKKMSASKVVNTILEDFFKNE